MLTEDLVDRVGEHLDGATERVRLEGSRINPA
jgi:hypothetical protein